MSHSLQVERKRATFTLAASTAYDAATRINLCAVPAGVIQQGILQLTVSIESDASADAVVEVWLAKIQETQVGGTPLADADFYYSGFAIRDGTDAPTLTLNFASWPAVQIRVKGGATHSTGGAVVVNAACI